MEEEEVAAPAFWSHHYMYTKLRCMAATIGSHMCSSSSRSRAVNCFFKGVFEKNHWRIELI
jgi:hypothetical protein